MNRSQSLPAQNIDIAELHRRVPVADAHADSLMWNRDLCINSGAGHVDFPRLRKAGVKLQCFTIVTRGFPLIDGFRLFAAKQGWPKGARKSAWTRCVWQIDRLEQFCLASNEMAAVTPTATALEQNLQRDTISAILGVEGGHALEGNVDRVAELFRRGVRFMSLTHLTNNELGGTSTPLFGNKPLTPLGREVLSAMAEVGMAVDIAHASRATLASLLSDSKVRLFCSHAGVSGATSLWRNLTDETLRTLANRGGVVGIIFARQYVGGPTFDNVARHIEHAVNVMGEDGVALGADYDGMIPLPQGMRDVADLPKLTETLVRRRLPIRVVEKVLGTNLKQFFLSQLPSEATGESFV